MSRLKELVPKELLGKLNKLEYKLSDENEDDESVTFEFIKKIDDYLIQLYAFYRTWGEDRDKRFEIQLYEGHIGNSPPEIDEAGNVHPEMGVECMIVESNDEKEFTSSLEKWDKEAINKAEYFIEKTSGYETNNMRQFGMSGNMSKLFDMVSNSKDVGRNDPCPCDSGKKYKHCCLD